MASYNYRAINASGQIISGVLVAKDRAEVMSMMHQKEYRPISINEKLEHKEINAKSFNRIKTKDIAVFCRQFYTMLNSGISIIQCLDILRQQFDNRKLRAVIDEVYELVQKGMSLSDAMRQHRAVFPELLINMTDAGEASGNIDTILGRMAEHYEKETRIKRKIVGAMTYPLVLVILTVVVVAFLLTFVLPTFVEVFVSNNVTLPLPTRIVLGVSYVLRNYWYIVIGIIILIILSIRYYAKTKSGLMFLDRLKLRLPVFGRLGVQVSTERFARTLSTLMASGIPLLNGMEITSRVIGNKVYEKAILDIREEVRKGYDLASPIKRTGLFPPMVDSMVRIGEESGSLDDVLKRTADFYGEEVDMTIQKMTSIIEPLLIVFMAIVIGTIVIAMLLPMFEMYQYIA